MLIGDDDVLQRYVNVGPGAVGSGCLQLTASRHGYSQVCREVVHWQRVMVIGRASNQLQDDIGSSCIAEVNGES